MELRPVDPRELGRHQRQALQQSGQAVQLLKDPQGGDYFLKGSPDAPPIRLPRVGNEDIPFKSLENRLDFSVLHATSDKDVATICQRALQSRSASVTCSPQWLPVVAHCLDGEPIKICCVLPEAGAEAAQAAVKDGADELSIAMDRAALEAGQTDEIRRQIASVVKAADGHAVKVLVPSRHLEDSTIAQAAQLAEAAGAAYVGNLDDDWKHAVDVFHESCHLPIQVTGSIQTLGECASLVQHFPDRHIRFLTDSVPQILREDHSTVARQVR
ncbi:MAG: hypothetical protein ACYCW6_16640, partial [Candidatus Xenobia bacterium]